MAALTKRLLLLRPTPYPLRHFSSSSSSDPPFPTPHPESPSPSPNPNPNPSYFADVKSSLRQPPPPPQRRPLTFSNRPSNPPPPPPTSAAALDEIRKNLSAFRARTAPPTPTSPSSSQPISMEQLYNRNINSPSSPSSPLRFDAIRESLRNLKPNSPQPLDRASLSHYRDSLKLKPNQNVVSGFPSLYGKGFVRTRSHQELGNKLKMLRPEKKKGKWFSLKELSERVEKVKEMEENERASGGFGDTHKELRDGLRRLGDDQAEKKMEERARKEACEFVLLTRLF